MELTGPLQLLEMRFLQRVVLRRLLGVLYLASARTTLEGVVAEPRALLVIPALLAIQVIQGQLATVLRDQLVPQEEGVEVGAQGILGQQAILGQEGQLARRPIPVPQEPRATRAGQDQLAFLAPLQIQVPQGLLVLRGVKACLVIAV